MERFTRVIFELFKVETDFKAGCVSVVCGEAFKKTLALYDIMTDDTGANIELRAKLQKQKEAKEKVAQLVAMYEKETDVHWRSENHTFGYIERNGIRHTFQIDKYGFKTCKNKVIQPCGDLNVFKQLVSGTFRG